MKALKQILVRGCITYTCLSLLFLLINLIVTAAAGDSLERAPIPALTFLMLFPFGLAMAAGGMLPHRFPHGPGRLCHYLITLLSLWLFLLLPSGVQTRASTMLVLFAVVTLLYWGVFGLITLTRGRFRRIMNDSEFKESN